MIENRSKIFFFLLLFSLFPSVSNSQIITTFAGNGTRAYSGDGGPATLAELNEPFSTCADSAGNIYIADDANYCIRKVNAVTGVMTTFAGIGTTGFSGDGGPASLAQFGLPVAVVMDSLGNLYVNDNINGRIRRIDGTTGIITTFAGNGVYGFSGDDGPATLASFANAQGIAFDKFNNLYIADAWNQRIREVNTTTGIITTIVGNGTAGFSGDGGPATIASLNYPQCIALDSYGNIIILDGENCRIREVDSLSRIITTIAGNGSCTFSGDGGPATLASINAQDDENGIVCDCRNDIIFPETYSSRIREIDSTTGIINTIAGTGMNGFSGDGGPATLAELSDQLHSVSLDNKGNLFICDVTYDRVREVTGLVTGCPTLTPTPTSVFSGSPGCQSTMSLSKNVSFPRTMCRLSKSRPTIVTAGSTRSRYTTPLGNWYEY